MGKKEKMYYHEFCVKTIYEILRMDISKEQLNNQVFKYAVKGGIIGQYAETYIWNGKEFKFWNLDFHTGNYQKTKIWKNLFSSTVADELCCKIAKGEVKDNKKNRTAPFYEHILPKNIIYKKIIDLKDNEDITEENVKAILEQSKIIMLTYDEKDCLDKAPNNCFTIEDEEVIEYLRKNGKIDDAISEEAISSMKGEKEKYLDTKENGTSYARFAHLYRCGVKSFLYKGKTYSDDNAIEGFRSFMENNSHLMKEYSDL